MDITGIGVSVPQVTDNALVNAVSTEVLAQSLDTQEALGNDMIKMMEQSVAPHLGSSIDISL